MPSWCFQLFCFSLTNCFCDLFTFVNSHRWHHPSLSRIHYSHASNNDPDINSHCRHLPYHHKANIHCSKYFNSSCVRLAIINNHPVVTPWWQLSLLVLWLLQSLLSPQQSCSNSWRHTTRENWPPGRPLYQPWTEKLYWLTLISMPKLFKYKIPMGNNNNWSKDKGIEGT